MKEFFKKLSIPAYLLPVSAVVSLVAMIILFASNADPNYVHSRCRPLGSLYHPFHRRILP